MPVEHVESKPPRAPLPVTAPRPALRVDEGSPKVARAAAPVRTDGRPTARHQARARLETA